MTVITSIYREFWGTEQFRRSLALLHCEPINAHAGHQWCGNGNAIRYIYGAFKGLPAGELTSYLDGADTFVLRDIVVPEEYILYSTEKACYPLPEIACEFPEITRWRYLNGGGYCGPAGLICEFMERYGLSRLSGDVNGQLEQQLAYLKAAKEGFPIRLDVDCTEFQTIAFESPDEFAVYPGGMLYNRITDSFPAAIHGNGRTEMKWIYELR